MIRRQSQRKAVQRTEIDIDVEVVGVQPDDLALSGESGASSVAV